MLTSSLLVQMEVLRGDNTNSTYKPKDATIRSMMILSLLLSSKSGMLFVCESGCVSTSNREMVDASVVCAFHFIGCVGGVLSMMLKARRMSSTL